APRATYYTFFNSSVTSVFNNETISGVFTDIFFCCLYCSVAKATIALLGIPIALLSASNQSFNSAETRTLKRIGSLSSIILSPLLIELGSWQECMPHLSHTFYPALP